MNTLKHITKEIFYNFSSRKFIIVNDILAFTTIISIVTIILETVTSLNFLHPLFKVVEYVSVVLFSFEYIGRVIAAPKKRDYIFSFFGLVDLISILPTYFGITNLMPLKSARMLRILRFLRVIRLTKISRLGISHTKHTDLEDLSYIYRLNIKIYIITVVTVVIILGSIMYLFEHTQADFANIPKSMFWVLETILGGRISRTIPLTVAGGIVGLVTKFSGLVLLGFLIHIVGNSINHLLLGTKNKQTVEDVVEGK
jgi:voltage-gated potassium channel